MNYPIVIPLHHAGGKLRDNTELRYALRSLAAHFKDGFTLAIVGKKMPDWAQGIEHIPSNQGLKSALKDAAARFPDGFFWWYDDLTLLQDITGEEMKVTPACKGWGGAQTGWSRSLNSIKERLVKEGYKPWDYSRPHGPYWFNKAMVDEGFADWPGMKSKFPWESWILSKRDWPRRFGVVKQYYGPFRSEPGEHSVYLNYNDRGNSTELRAWLEKRFPEPSEFEISADGTNPTAKVRFRLKGEADSPVYQGQKIVKPCRGCGSKKREPSPITLQNTSNPMNTHLIGKKLALSFSLYGEGAKYAVGAIENVRLAKEIYPGWEVVMHVEKGHYAAPRLEAMGARVIFHDKASKHGGMQWRFESLNDPKYHAVCVRDADSRLTWREKVAVDEWLASDKAFHVMKDHKHHRKPIMGGAFGCLVGAFNFGDIFNNGNVNYGDDEALLAEHVWPLVKDLTICHTDSGEKGALRFPPHPPQKTHVLERTELSSVNFVEGLNARAVLLSVEHYHQRRGRFYESLQKNGGFLNRSNLEWWQATHHSKCFAPTSFRDVRKRKHWWAATCDHLKIMEETIAAGFDHLFLFEDDAVFLPHFEEGFWKAWCALPTKWKAMRLGWHDYPPTGIVVPGVLDRCDTKSGLMIANFWNREGLIRAYDHVWHRRKMIIDMAFADLRKIEPNDWYQPAQMIVTYDTKTQQKGNDK